MNREKTIEIVRKAAAELAEEMGFDYFKTDKGDCGLWDMDFGHGIGAMTRSLEKKYGDCSTEITWKPEKEAKQYIRTRFRFGEPCVCVNTKDDDGNQVLCEIEFHDMRMGDTGKYENTGNYEMKNITVFGGLEGEKLYFRMKEKLQKYGAV